MISQQQVKGLWRALVASGTLSAAAKLSAVVLAVVLLPNRGFGPWQVLNAYKIGLMVLIISGLDFAGYMASRAIGAKHGILVTALLGGLISSTAVTMTMAGRARHEPRLTKLAALAIQSASLMMLIRLVGLSLAVDPALLLELSFSLGAMLATFVVGLIYSLRRWQLESDQNAPLLTEQFRLRRALQFGALYGCVLVAAKAAKIWFGDAGLYLSAVLAGLADVDAISLSVMSLHQAGLDANVAARTMTLAILSNTLVKFAISAALGGKTLVRRLAPTFVASVMVGGGASLLRWMVAS